MCEQVLRVKTLRIKGFESPVSCVNAFLSERTGQLTLSCNHVGNLDDWINRRLWENTLPTSAFNIETKNS